VSDYPASHRHTVLVVDDEAQMRRVIADILHRDGYEVLEAADTVQADAILERILPCMMLVDVVLPGMNGLSYCASLKHDPRTEHIPVALVTGREKREDVEAGIAAGAVDYIKKPFDRDEIRLRVRSQIRRHEELRERQRVEDQLRTVALAVHDAIIVMDDNGLVTMWNDGATRMFGFGPLEVRDKRLHDLVAPARFRPAYEATLARFRETGQGPAVGTTVELVALRKSGEEFPVELSLAAARLSGRWHAVGVVRDITDRKRAEQLLRRSEARLTTILDRMEVGVAIIGMDRRISGPTLRLSVWRASNRWRRWPHSGVPTGFARRRRGAARCSTWASASSGASERSGAMMAARSRPSRACSRSSSTMSVCCSRR